MPAKLIAVATLVVVGIAGWHLWSSSRPYQVDVYVLSAERLVTGNDVQLGGVTIGQVNGVRLAPDTDQAGAVLNIQIDARYAPLQRGTRALIRPKGLLGTMYLELQPGHSGQPIPSGGTIPIQDTQSPVSLDQVTDVFDARTRQQVQTLTRQGGVALKGQGKDVNQVLQQLPQISSNLAATTGALDQRTQQLDELQVEFDRLAGMTAGEDTSLRGDLSNGATILDTLAQHQQGLQQELTHANSSLGQANAALAGHQQDLHQLLLELPALLDELRTFQGQAAGTFATVNPCMNDLLTMLAEMRSSTGYNEPAGATDGAGSMLRVDPVLLDASGQISSTYSPSASCSGTGG